jgi:hypothetical protein
MKGSKQGTPSRAEDRGIRMHCGWSTQATYIVLVSSSVWAPEHKYSICLRFHFILFPPLGEEESDVSTNAKCTTACSERQAPIFSQQT